MLQEECYDIIVIGGGIAGINTALKLSKSRKVLLLDDRKYWGGRINTKTQPHYEIGAARFSNKHKFLNRLIKKYQLNKLPLPQNIDYLHKKDDCVEFVSDVHKILDKYFKGMVAKSNLYTKRELKSMTLFEFMNICSDKETSKQIVNMFGYVSEIKMMNAYDALNIFKQEFVNTQYYILAEGLSLLCNKMIAGAQQNGCVCHLNSFVQSANKKDDVFEVKTTTKTFIGHNVVFAIKGPQLKQFDLLKNIHKYIECVHDSELLRIYAKYPFRQDGVWFNNLRRMTTNSFLRQIIPIDYHEGLIMISYTDGEDVKEFKDKKNKILNEVKIKNKIQTELNLLFKCKIPHPTYFKIHYWNVGAHYWKPGYDSEKISELMINPLKNVYICGEAFSQKQAWIEGGLETSEEVVRKLEK